MSLFVLSSTVEQRYYGIQRCSVALSVIVVTVTPVNQIDGLIESIDCQRLDTPGVTSGKKSVPCRLTA